MNNKKIFGFTIAEVLITLTVIGIISAITIPTLMYKNRERVIRSKFKKVYAVMSEALINAVDEYGSIPECYYGKVNAQKACKDFINNYFFQKIKYQKYCSKNSYANGCVPDYKTEDFTTSSGCAGLSAKSIKTRCPAIILQDGSILFQYQNPYGPITGMDINGFDGPNQPGIDVYSLDIRHTGENIEFRANGGSAEQYYKGKSILHCLPKSKNAIFTDINKILE